MTTPEKLNRKHIGQFVTLSSSRWKTIVSGTYLGVMEDEGEAYHFFQGGVIGATPQIRLDGTEVRHGFPVSRTYDHQIVKAN